MASNPNSREFFFPFYRSEYGVSNLYSPDLWRNNSCLDLPRIYIDISAPILSLIMPSSELILRFDLGTRDSTSPGPVRKCSLLWSWGFYI